MTTIPEIRADLVAVIAKIDEVAPVPAPVPNPVPVPPAPPIIGTGNAFGATELLSKLATAKPGGTIVARAGAFGAVAVKGVNRGGRVTVLCEAGAHFERLAIAGSANLTFDGLPAWSDKIPPVKGLPIVSSDAASSGIEIIRGDIRAAVDAADYYNWDMARWRAQNCMGVMLKGAKSAIRDSHLTAFNIHATMQGPGSAFEGNKVRGVSQDAWRIVGNGAGFVVRGNDIADYVTISAGAEHPDGTQAWSALPGQKPGTGLLADIVIEGNRYREWIGNPTHPMWIHNQGTPTTPLGMQGIGFHDGMYANVVFRDNEIWTSTWLAIRITKADGVRIEGNRCYDMLRRAKLDFAFIRALGAQNLSLTGNTSGRTELPAGVVAANHSKPDYATLPDMSLAA